MPDTTSAEARDLFNLKLKSLRKLEQSFHAIGDTATADILAVKIVNLHIRGIAAKAGETMKLLNQRNKDS